ncbi:acyl carrier protein [Actinomadura adrarensis]|uniref:Acyl carrier protein n=1 Tax=Actinomadura adrarensis TaxID=1819600 RepID=A0ABW3CLQ8_9ACTN
MSELTLEDLRRLMRASAGDDETVDLEGDILDRPFEELNYDSLALLELSVQLFQEYGIEVEDDALTDLKTPGAVLDHINALKSAAA